MDAQKNRHRMVFLTIVMGVCFVTLGCRLVDLQVLQHEEFARLAEDQHDHFYYREAPRGDILDRRGSPLATSVPVRRVCVDPLSLKGQEVEMAAIQKRFERVDALRKKELDEIRAVMSADQLVRLNKNVEDEHEADLANASRQEVRRDRQRQRPPA